MCCHFEIYVYIFDVAILASLFVCFVFLSLSQVPTAVMKVPLTDTVSCDRTGDFGLFTEGLLDVTEDIRPNLNRKLWFHNCHNQ